MYDQLASMLMFTKIESMAETLGKLGLEYRKGKGVEDVRKARDKGLKAGLGKVEFELSMMEVYLKEVLKESRKKKELAVA